MTKKIIMFVAKMSRVFWLVDFLMFAELSLLFILLVP